MSSTDFSIDQADIDKLNDKDKAELRQFFANEEQRARIQSRTATPPRPSSVSKQTNHTVRATSRIPRTNSNLLEKMHHLDLDRLQQRALPLLRQRRRARQERAGLPGQLCGPVHGRQHGDDEAPCEYAAAVDSACSRDRVEGRVVVYNGGLQRWFTTVGRGENRTMEILGIELGGLRVREVKGRVELLSWCCRGKEGVYYILATGIAGVGRG